MKLLPKHAPKLEPSLDTAYDLRNFFRGYSTYFYMAMHILKFNQTAAESNINLKGGICNLWKASIR
jgi:hypothetical protein